MPSRNPLRVRRLADLAGLVGPAIVLAIIVAAALALAGCAGGPTPAPRPEIVPVPVRVPCVAEIPPEPAYASKRERTEADDGRYVILLTRDYMHARGHADELRALLEACKAAGGA